jgi:putative MATE family efflux protein
MADTYFVGSLGTSATAAVGLSFSLMAAIQAAGFFFGQGSGNFIARALGRRDNETASRMAAAGFFSAFAAGALIAGAGSVFLEPLAWLLGASDSSLPFALDYLRFILLGAPFMAASLTLNNLLRFQGSAFYGMLGMTSGAVLNVVLDPLLIFGLSLGVAGASIATMLSQTLSCMLLFFLSRRGGNISVRLKNFSPTVALYREIARGGLPSLLRQGIGSVAVIVLNRTARGYGDATVAAMSIVNRVALFAASALLGFGQGFQPVCGFNYGAGLYHRVRRAFWFCVRVSSAALFVLACLGFIFAPEIIALFRRDDPEVIRIGTFALRLVCVPFPLLGWIILNNMLMQTIGKAFSASVLALSRHGLFLIPLLAILTPAFGVLGIQLAAPVSDLCTFIVSVPLNLAVLRQMKDAG